MTIVILDFGGLIFVFSEVGADPKNIMLFADFRLWQMEGSSASLPPTCRCRKWGMEF